MSSASARLGSPNEYVDYAASKGALETFTTGLAKEVAREGIRVNCVRPGHIYTDMHASGGEPDRVNRVRDSIPMGRGGQPEEVARAVLWLASEEASFITGTFSTSPAASEPARRVSHRPLRHRPRRSGWPGNPARRSAPAG
jgi:NAD(P)-dependent dehydrogenase (short-subunit alcohol dehydrogenase family)